MWEWNLDLGGTTYDSLDMSANYDIGCIVDLMVECTHSLGEFLLAQVANQFRHKLLGFSLYDGCKLDHKIISTL